MIDLPKEHQDRMIRAIVASKLRDFSSERKANGGDQAVFAHLATTVHLWPDSLVAFFLVINFGDPIHCALAALALGNWRGLEAVEQAAKQ